MISDAVRSAARLLQRLVAIVAALVAMASSANAGVGMLGEGFNLSSTSLSATGGSHHWDVQRKVIPSICQRRNASLVQGYEYGYSYFHTVFASVAFAYRKCGQINRAARINPLTWRVRPEYTILAGQSMGLGDVIVGVRTRLNHIDTASWEILLAIPTGYDNNSAARLGRGALGLGVGLLFSSLPYSVTSNPNPWGWSLGSRFTYYFSGKGNTLQSFIAAQYALTDTNFEQTGDFGEIRLAHSTGFALSGVQQQIFFNQVPNSMTNSDQTVLQLKYSHSFSTGLSTSAHIGKAFFGRNTPIDYNFGLGLSYRWKD